jgi:hypothetical protein
MLSSAFLATNQHLKSFSLPRPRGNSVRTNFALFPQRFQEIAEAAWPIRTMRGLSPAATKSPAIRQRPKAQAAENSIQNKCVSSWAKTL